jgi:xylan 1,4-beta-xylosidase
MAYLCGRPLRNRGRCVLGRETAIQRMTWGADGWLRTAGNDAVPLVRVTAPDLPAHPWPAAPARADFDAPELPIDFQWLRSPQPERLFSLTARPGHLRLFGRESIGSLFEQALVARRQQDFCYTAATRVDFEPQHYQQAAGLVCYYGGSKFHYLHITHDDAQGRHLRVMSALPDQPQADAFTAPVPLQPGPVELRVAVDYERLRFSFREEGGAWRVLPEQFDASILSDEATAPGNPNFTGAFVGMACQDMAGTGLHADFDWFEYRERAYEP